MFIFPNAVLGILSINKIFFGILKDAVFVFKYFRIASFSKIESFLRTIYKQEKKIREKRDSWRKNPQDFYMERLISFDGIIKKGTKEISYYCKKNKKIVSIV